MCDSDKVQLTYIGESGDKLIFKVEDKFSQYGYATMRKAHHRDFPKVIPKPFEEALEDE